MENEKENLNNENTSQNEEGFIIGKDFTVDGDVEANEAPEKNPRGRHSRKSRNIVKNTIWILSIIIVSVGIAFGIIFAGADYMGIGFGRGENCVIEIERGSSAKQITEKLQECGAVKFPLLFRVYAKAKHYDSQFKYGVYNFNNEAGYDALAQMLIEEGAVSENVTVTIPEMSTVDEIADILEKAGVCTKTDFIDVVQNGKFDYDFIKDIPSETVYYRLEGYLFPDTYNFYCYESKECAYLAVEKMLDELNSHLTSDMLTKIKNGKYSLHEVMTMASIVELEAGGEPSEMKNVSAVFYNRLASPDFSKLESSPTQKYPYGNGKYDTYKCLGLPPGPLCSPSANSIAAAVSPTENFEYYYFVTDAKMKFYYNKTLAQHNSTIAKLKKENNWIGDN